MKISQSFVIQMRGLTRIRRERILPVSGQVFVRKGQRVSGSDVVAQTILNQKHSMFDVTKILGISLTEIDQHIKVNTGSAIERGDIIAGPVGITRKVLRSPLGGVVKYKNEGQILIEAEVEPIQLLAGFPGEVIDLIPNRGAVIETTGALVQGVWGNELIGNGNILVRKKTQNDNLETSDINESIRDSIIYTGHVKSENVLLTAQKLEIQGLVLSSMNPELIPKAQNVTFPIVVLEGFGRIPVNSIASKILEDNHSMNSVVNAQNMDKIKGARPEVIIPIATLDEVPEKEVQPSFAPEQQVKIIRASHVAEIGTVVRILENKKFQNGIISDAAEIRLENDLKIVIPLCNLEIVI